MYFQHDFQKPFLNRFFEKTIRENPIFIFFIFFLDIFFSFVFFFSELPLLECVRNSSHAETRVHIDIVTRRQCVEQVFAGAPQLQRGERFFFHML